MMTSLQRIELLRRGLRAGGGEYERALPDSCNSSVEFPLPIVGGREVPE